MFRNITVWVVIILIGAAASFLREPLMKWRQNAAYDSQTALKIFPPDQQTVVPDFTVSTLDGKTVTLSQAVQSGPVVIDLWATWCGPCLAELPQLDAIREQYEPKGVHFYGISVADSPTDVTTYVDRQGLGIPMLVDSDHRVAMSYGHHAIPCLVVVGRGCKVLTDCEGRDPNLPSDLPAALDVALDQNL